jgi:hypothetical protein
MKKCGIEREREIGAESGMYKSIQIAKQSFEIFGGAALSEEGRVSDINGIEKQRERRTSRV